MGNVRGTRTLNSKWDFKRIVAILVLVAIFVVSVCFIRFGLVEESEDSATSHFVRATVSQLIQDNTHKDETTEGILRGSQEVIVQISSGPFRGKKYQTTNYLSALFNINAQEGTRVIVRLDPQNDGYSAFIYSYDRNDYNTVGGDFEFPQFHDTQYSKQEVAG